MLLPWLAALALAGQTAAAWSAGALAVGTVLDVPLAQLHPTQPSVGHDEVLGKLARWQADPQRWSQDPAQQLSYLNRTLGNKFSSYCEDIGQLGLAQAFQQADQALAARLDNPASFTCAGPAPKAPGDPGHAALKPVVIGPGGALYLTDGHHGYTALVEAPDGGPMLPVRVRVAADFSHLSPDAFWRRMEKDGHAWLQDANGHPVSPKQLPQHLGLACPGQTEFMADDPYRSLVYYTRGLGFKAGGLPNFAEFHWADWLRAQANTSDGTPWVLDHYDLNNAALASLDTPASPSRPGYAQAVFDAVKKMRALPPDSVVTERFTAKALGAYSPKAAQTQHASAKDTPAAHWLNEVNALLRSDEKADGQARTGGKLWYALKGRQQRPSCPQ